MSKIDDDSNHNSVHLEHAQANPKAEDVPAGHHGMPDILTQQVMVSHLDETNRSTRLRNRVDLRVTFILAVLYIWQGIDKGNIGNVGPHLNPSIVKNLAYLPFQANIAGMNTDLKLYIGNRYSVVTMVVSDIDRPYLKHYLTLAVQVLHWLHSHPYSCGILEPQGWSGDMDSGNLSVRAIHSPTKAAMSNIFLGSGGK
jgi:hypothetical protein